MKILITGARSNIGYALSKLLALRGHIVYAGCKTLKEKEMLDKKIRDEKIIMFPLVLDLLNNNIDFKSLDIDTLILHASTCNGGSVLEISDKRLEEDIDVNIKGNFRLLQKFLRYCYDNNKKGKIFVTSSLAAFYPLPYLSSYTSSKIYLYNLIKTLKLELLYQNLDIKVSLIMPGAYYTGFNDLMINNKEKDPYILKNKAVGMSKYQKILFSLLEQENYDELIRKIVKEIEKDKPSFIISLPLYQKIFTKLYVIFRTL